MKKIAISLVIFTIVSFLVLPFCEAQGKTEGKEVILTTGDIREGYKIAMSGIITCKGPSTEIDKLIENLRKEAEKIGADAVIFVRFISFGGYLFIYGTPVKLLEKE